MTSTTIKASWERALESDENALSSHWQDYLLTPPLAPSYVRKVYPNVSPFGWVIELESSAAMVDRQHRVLQDQSFGPNSDESGIVDCAYYRVNTVNCSSALRGKIEARVYSRWDSMVTLIVPTDCVSGLET